MTYGELYMKWMQDLARRKKIKGIMMENEKQKYTLGVKVNAAWFKRVAEIRHQFKLYWVGLK